MEVVFKSCSAFINKAVGDLQRGDIRQDLDISIDSKATLLDLFSIGRLLSFLDAANRHYGCKARFSFPSSRANSARLVRLSELGFFKYCNAIPYLNHTAGDISIQQQLPFARAIGEKKAYWFCLIPLQTICVEPCKTEANIDTQVRQHLKSLSHQICKGLERIQISYDQVGVEISRILYTCFREMISNTITHSGTRSFICAMTISREAGSIRRQHRPGSDPVSGEHKYDLLIADMGRGIFQSAMQTLNADFREPSTDYLAPAVWSSLFSSDYQREQSIISCLFHDDLVIRRGRRSEGLHDSRPSW